ncbi:hypothetical protein LC653_28915 [Nostoc sp. CHAB 5784]|uniref:hypothetical protein n=1 Tax=Nostoc mirabile TaxID=2907820 RepID=UPI001E29F03B|nr:hypothetical protein [Nostoc mirabile]MCC5667792.1 hypothetical protein [Nostoc mirabile CHAB5784]
MVGQSVRRYSRLRLLAPTVSLLGRLGLLESLGNCYHLPHQDGQDRQCAGCECRGGSDAYGGLFGVAVWNFHSTSVLKKGQAIARVQL